MGSVSWRRDAERRRQDAGRKDPPHSHGARKLLRADFDRNGWAVQALQGAWSAITHAVPTEGEPGVRGDGACHSAGRAPWRFR